jgi:hypothetical protein
VCNFPLYHERSSRNTNLTAFPYTFYALRIKLNKKILQLGPCIFQIVVKEGQTKCIVQNNHIFRISSCSYMFRHDIHDVAYVRFYKNYIGLPEDGAPDAPKHVRAIWYSKYMVILKNAFRWFFFHHKQENITTFRVQNDKCVSAICRCVNTKDKTALRVRVQRMNIHGDIPKVSCNLRGMNLLKRCCRRFRSSSYVTPSGLLNSDRIFEWFSAVICRISENPRRNAWGWRWRHVQGMF